MSTRFAFVGFRHAHILDLLAGVLGRDDTQLVACCEEDGAARASIEKAGKATITHTNFQTMLREVDCDVIAIGDYYARRGSLAKQALAAGKHLLSDKPLCTSHAEFAEIKALAAERQRVVSLQLDSRGYGAFRKLREIVRAGEIGEIVTLRIDGQHPLLLGTRPAWYFEPGQHGGTINDIGIHAFDFVPWITGLDWREIVAARSWNAKARDFPHFHDSAQLMATLENGAGVLADFSYLAPDRLGYKLPHYWQLRLHGTRGIAETDLQAAEVVIIRDEDDAPQKVAAPEVVPRRYLDDFLNEIAGRRDAADLTSEECLRATHLALEAQQLADRERKPRM